MLQIRLCSNIQATYKRRIFLLLHDQRIAVLTFDECKNLSSVDLVMKGLSSARVYSAAKLACVNFNKDVCSQEQSIQFYLPIFHQQYSHFA